MLRTRCRRSRGSSKTNGADSPGRTFAANRPTRRISAPAVPTTPTSTQGEIATPIASRTAIWAEQGTAKANNSVAITRWRPVSSVRVVTVAMVSQPRPRTIGSPAWPLRPILRIRRWAVTASRARYPNLR